MSSTLAQETIELLKKYNFNTRKRFGQNFLIDEHVLSKIINAASLTKDDFVLEIGPGLGTMTKSLCENARMVYAVEIDRDLIPVIKERLSGYDNLELVNADILKTDIGQIAEKYNEGRPIKVVANLPYYVTTPIIMTLFEQHVPLKSVTVMVQKEVAVRMQAGPGTKDYGALSLSVAYYASAYIDAYVPRNCFIPRPGVDSAVITLTAREEPPVEVADEQLMFRLIRAAFNQRRKTLVNAINNSAELAFTREEILSAITAIGKKETVRGEELTLPDFALLTQSLLPLAGRKASSGRLICADRSEAETGGAKRRMRVT